MCMDFMSQYFSYIHEIASFHVGQSFHWANFWITIDLWSSLCIIASAMLYVNKFIDVVYVSIPYNFRHDIIYWDLISYLRFFGTFISSVSLWDYHGVFYTSNNHLVFMLHIFHQGFYLESICLPCLWHVIIK